MFIAGAGLLFLVFRRSHGGFISGIANLRFREWAEGSGSGSIGGTTLDRFPRSCAFWRWQSVPDKLYRFYPVRFPRRYCSPHPPETNPPPQQFAQPPRPGPRCTAHTGLGQTAAQPRVFGTVLQNPGSTFWA